MTEQQTPPTALVKPASGSRLETLAAAFREAQEAFNAAKARFEEVKDAIKVELVRAQPDADNITLWSPVLEKPLRLRHYEGSWSIDSKRMKKEDPVTYVKWAKQGADFWKLEAA